MIRFSQVTLLILVVGLASATRGDLRVRPAEFTSDYQFPATSAPLPRAKLFEYVDLVVLVAAIALASFFTLRTRSRRALFILMLIALGYFGFYRGGCVCPIGAIQNVAMGLFNPDYRVPMVVLAFFLLPLVFTLLFGRTFCGSVCPLGAIQDLVALRPIRIAKWVEHSLGLLPWIYLSAAVVLAGMGCTFIICRADPFVSIFRIIPVGKWANALLHQAPPPGGVLGISGKVEMLILAGIFLMIGVFVARPYCRFLCPYGAILRVFSRLSWRHTTITPDECVQCRLCEQSCPYNAIRRPSGPGPGAARSKEKKRLAILILLLPALTAAGAVMGRSVSEQLAKLDYTVALAERVRLEETLLVEGQTDASEAFRATGRPNSDLYAQSLGIKGSYRTATAVMGGFIGMVIALKLISLSVHRTRTDYLPDRAKCISCGRCWSFCPVEQQRLKKAQSNGATGNE